MKPDTPLMDFASTPSATRDSAIPKSDVPYSSDSKRKTVPDALSFPLRPYKPKSAKPNSIIKSR